MTPKRNDRGRHLGGKPARSAEGLLTPFVQALRAQDKSATTAHAYQNDAQQFAEWLTQTRGEAYPTIQEFVRAITPTDVREYRAHLLNVQRASPATINRRLVALRVLTRWARGAPSGHGG